ncbi:ectoine synthase [Leisingera aquaemixtae]|uniref:L-ectoine synthase n=1 Tax=Leisingera aquaemixtae TaxID=1396826 RepID=A0ABY5WK12_9RHOB|nr:ectoine synthase [Leisingera aquaemixtae]UWQ41836.1 ectoine synthase [Leisingera aquaemixtae]
MFLRDISSIEAVNWGNGTSVRLLTKADNMGFTVCHTVVNRGTESKLQYRRHREACYCIKGQGKVVSADGQTVLEVLPGSLYVLDQHDAHHLIADPEEDLHLVSVFNPPLDGTEHHQLDAAGYSQY